MLLAVLGKFQKNTITCSTVILLQEPNKYLNIVIISFTQSP